MSDLKKLYTAKGPGDAHVLRGLLESEGIDVAIRGDDFVPLQGGGLFHVETRPSIWVLDDERYARAQEMAAEYARQGSHADAPSRLIKTVVGVMKSSRTINRHRSLSPSHSPRESIRLWLPSVDVACRYCSN